MSDKRKSEFAALPEDVRGRHQRADGFIDLQLLPRARSELDGVPAPLRTVTPYLDLALRLALAQEDWPAAIRAARDLVQRAPDDAGYLVQLAYATRRAEGIEPARFILEEARKKFPDVAVISFNLACYACQSGRNDQALTHLGRAFKLDPHCREMALEDEDLKPLWPKLEEDA